MNIELSKYLTNKEITISNDDFDLNKLEKDIYKGYTKNSEIEKPDYSGYVKKEDFDKLQSDYATLETDNNNNIKKLSDTNDKMTRISFEKQLIKKGFKDENFDELIKLRNSIFADEKDDIKAIDQMVDKYGKVYLEEKKVPNFTQAPNEAGVNGDKGSKPNDIKITRKTSIKDLIVQK